MEFIPLFLMNVKMKKLNLGILVLLLGILSVSPTYATSLTYWNNSDLTGDSVQVNIAYNASLSDTIISVYWAGGTSGYSAVGLDKFGFSVIKCNKW